MKVTITATHKGLTPFQKRELRRYLILLKVTEPWSTILYAVKHRPTIIVPPVFGTFVGGYVGSGEV